MAGSFKPGDALTRDDHDWGVFAQISGPRDGLSGIVAIEATFLAGKCHDFHRHPGQEEVNLAILSPSVGEDGYGVEDVSGDEPWASLR